MKKKHWDARYLANKSPLKLPTESCFRMAKECCLLKPTKCPSEYYEQLWLLKTFQREAAMNFSFESSAMYFMNRNLTEEQKKRLRAIHKLTPLWAEKAILSALAKEEKGESAWAPNDEPDEYLYRTLQVIKRETLKTLKNRADVYH